MSLAKGASLKRSHRTKEAPDCQSSQWWTSPLAKKTPPNVSPTARCQNSGRLMRGHVKRLVFRVFISTSGKIDIQTLNGKFSFQLFYKFTLQYNFLRKKIIISDWCEVELFRQEVMGRYKHDAPKKLNSDYSRTKDDFYRMDLDRLDEVHPINRPHMRKAYFAYLQNTPGSKKAIKECVKDLNGEQAQKAHWKMGVFIVTVLLSILKF